MLKQFLRNNFCVSFQAAGMEFFFLEQKRKLSRYQNYVPLFLVPFHDFYQQQQHSFVNTVA